MLSHTYRFHGLGSLKNVYRYGQNVKGPLLSLKFSKNPRRRTYRCAVIISRKVHRSAVLRNRIRRRIYEIIRNFSSQITDSYDLVIFVNSDKTALAEFNVLKNQVKDLLIQAKILNKSTNPKTARDMIDPKET